MTIEQARDAARKGMPVQYSGIRYMRIVRVGYGYTDHHDEIATVMLEDRNGNSTISVPPEAVSLIGLEDGGGVV